MEVYKYIEGYKSKLSLKENELAIRDIRHYFQVLLENNLHLIRVTAPLFVKSNIFCLSYIILFKWCRKTSWFFYRFK